ncbi:MAG: hypothetical protein HY815_05655 [Candidatus Riflebacteria bacterium]|nr:hypothetical protein [Candidatus Riflebacteria bacterium]
MARRLWPRPRPLVLALLALFLLAAAAHATNEGAATTDVGGRGADPGKYNAGASVRTDKTGLDAIRRMTRGSQGTAATVTANGALAVRSAPEFGPNISGTIEKGQQMVVKSRDGAWFSIEYPKQPAWVYVTFVEGDSPGDGFVPQPGATQLQLAIKQAAYNVLDQVPFPYAPETEGGNLGCAQVATTILKNAGAIGKVVLGVLAAIDLLRDKGWRDVTPPPYKDGDVITWKTYNRDGIPGDDPDTHIGVIVIENGKTYAVNNSSSHRRPEKHLLATYPAPMTRLMRAPGL